MQESWHRGRARKEVQNSRTLEIRTRRPLWGKITRTLLAERFYINKFYLTRVFKEAVRSGLVTGVPDTCASTQAKRLFPPIQRYKKY